MCYEHDPDFVLSRFRAGEFDYLDAASEVVETELFRFLGAQGYLEALAAHYPSPRLKQEVPTWFFLASNLSMRLHGSHSFHAYPYVVRCGGMLNAFGPELGHKAEHPESGDTTLSCAGFNRKNHYDRQTPCDPDFLRKLAKDTDPEQLEAWFNRDAAQLFHQQGAFDREGVFIGDASYVFVPDNPRYERSMRLLFDEHDHPVEAARLTGLTPQQAARYRWRRCYKLVSLLHTDRQRSFFLRVAARLLPGNVHECPVFYELLDEFIQAVGAGVVRRLLLDRGFLDGARIADVKQRHGIDVLIPLRHDMTLYQDALGLMALPEVVFRPYQPPARAPLEAPRLPHAPPAVRRREQRRQQTLKARAAAAPAASPEPHVVRSEVAGLADFRSWSSCPLPLSVIINRELDDAGQEQIWMLLDTRPLESADDPARRRDEYAIRTEIEEGHRQLKCFWDLADFTSRRFSLVLNQVLFVLLAYNLLQLYLLQQDRPELTRRTRPRVRHQLLPSDAVILIYCDQRFATLAPLAYTELVLTLAEEARRKILEKTRRLRRQLAREL
ncbi:MAG: transposase, partial [Candidatus Eisenbacteria bacterium]